MIETTSAAHALFDRDEIREVLETSFYRNEPEPVRTSKAPKKKGPGLVRPGRTKAARKPKPDHYEIICISLYVEDLTALDAKVEAPKPPGPRPLTPSAPPRSAPHRLAVEYGARPRL